MCLHAFQSSGVNKKNALNKLVSVQLYQRVTQRIQSIELFVSQFDSTYQAVAQFWKTDYFRKVLFDTMSLYRRKPQVGDNDGDNSKCILWSTCTPNKTIKWGRFRPVLVSDCIILKSGGNDSLHRENENSDPTTLDQVIMFPYAKLDHKYNSIYNRPKYRDNFYNMYKPRPGHPGLDTVIMTRIINAFIERNIKITDLQLQKHLVLKNNKLVFGWVFGGCKDAFVGKVRTVKKSINNINDHN